MDAHRIKVLNRADNDNVVSIIAHHFHLILFPANNGFFEQHFFDGRKCDPATDHVFELFDVVCNPAARTAQRETGSNNDRQSDVLYCFTCFVDIVNRETPGNVKSDFKHDLLECVAFFRPLDDLFFSANHFDAVFREHAVFDEFHRCVETSLTTKRRQQRVRALQFDDFFDVLPGDRFNIRPIGSARVGHNGRGVGIHQHDFVALFPQGFAGLSSRIVEFTCLADHNRAGTNDQNLLKVVTTWHLAVVLPVARSR